MRRGLLVGLTGGIGAGKSTALAEFARSGAATLSLDDIAKELAKPGKPGYRKVVKEFGPGFLAEDGTIDRAKLGREVFSNPRARRLLERLTHPLILREMNRRVAAAPKGRTVVVDVPLLFEKNLASLFDVTILVTAPAAARLSRVRRRDGLAPREVRARLAAQLPQEAKRALADAAVANDGSRARLRSRIREYHRSFQLITNDPRKGGA